MRTLSYALVFILFLLFFMPVKGADIFNVTGQTSKIINSGITVSLVGKTRMFCDTGYCYLIFTDWTKYHMTKWQRNNTYPFVNIVKTVSSAQNTVNPIPLSFDVMDYDNDKFYIVTKNSTNYLLRYWVYKDNLSVVIDNEIPTRIVDMLELSIDTSDFGIVYTNNTQNNENPREIRKLHYTTGYVNSSLMTYYTQPRMITSVYVPTTQEKYLFFSNSTSVYLYVFNQNNQFQTSYTINTNPIVKLSDFYSWNYEPVSSIYAYYYNSLVYFAIRQNSPNNNTWYVNVINPTETKNQGSLIELGSGQNIDLSLYDSWVGNSTRFTDNQTTALSFYYDDYPSKERWYIIYDRLRVNEVYGGKELMLLMTDKSCVCSDWINSSQCGYDGNGFITPNVLWQTRVCNPSSCASVGQFADCTEEPPQVNYKHITPLCSVCQPKSTNAQAFSQGYLIPAIDGSASCSMSYQIPNDVTNITSKVIISVSAEKTLLGITPDNNYTTIICNPLVSGNCLTNSYTCRNDANISYSKDYSSYTGGQTASASIGVSGVGLCAGSWGGVGYGWTRYWINGQLCVEYDKVCGGWKCTSIGTEQFEVQEKPDCTTNTTTLLNCVYGCEETTGRCKSSSLPTVSGDPLTYIFNLTSGTFSPIMLTLFAVLISGGLTVYGTIITKKWQIGIVIGMCIGLFFLSIGWLPSWLGILWILSVALLLMKAIFFKGD